MAAEDVLVAREGMANQHRIAAAGIERTVGLVRDLERAERNTGYTSTLKMMQVMCEKGLLKRDDAQRPQIYRPAIPQEQTQKKIVRELVKTVFGGSARKLVMQAVQSHKISREELAEIRNLLDQLEEGEP